MTAPAQRPRLGRPASSPSGVTSHTEAKTWDPEPTNNCAGNENKQTFTSTGVTSTGENVATSQSTAHATSNSGGDVPASEHPSGLTKGSGPPPVQPFGRPVRSTRNPAPYYVDAISKPWSASKEEIKQINNAINGHP